MLPYFIFADFPFFLICDLKITSKGDAPAHDIWAYSHGKSDFFLQNITSTFRKYYPTTKIYPVIGNHEGVPVNAFPDDDYWLYKDMATAWEEFRLEEQSYQSIARFFDLKLFELGYLY
jgi:hypothetical protein